MTAGNETAASAAKYPGGLSRPRFLLTLFLEYFKIALFVVGGGYAILAVADNVFGRRLKWLEEGELLDHLPVFQMIPGIIAGNTAVYTGLKLAGYTGALVAQAAVALPSIIIFTAVSMGYNALPVDNPLVAGVFLGLRSSLVGIIAGTIASGWRRNVRGAYGYAAFAVASVALVMRGAGILAVLVAAALAGIALEFCGLGDARAFDSAGISAAPVPRRAKIAACAAVAAALAAITLIYGNLFWIFVKFGLMSFGGGFVLIPAYTAEFVGPDAPALNIPLHEFGNLMALTQMTPGPVSVNSATFFGFRFAGIPGALVATAGLFFPSYVLLTTALTGLDRWKDNRFVRGLLRGVRPATVAMMVSACLTFSGMSLWSRLPEGGVSVSPLGCAIAAGAIAAMLSRRVSVMAIIFASAAVGLAAAAL
ncbi:MAG: chromate transporter [Kiritimatiellae bacterium]|nr:chromate transporter [Kiritimatiellia bacterium]